MAAILEAASAVTLVASDWSLVATFPIFSVAAANWGFDTRDL